MPSEGRAPPRDYKICIQDITATLIACGYYSLDAQAKALGINRSTAWTIVRNKHKLGRLSAKTTERMLSNGALPPSVRLVLLRYLCERFSKNVSKNELCFSTREKIRQRSTSVPFQNRRNVNEFSKE